MTEVVVVQVEQVPAAPAGTVALPLDSEPDPAGLSVPSLCYPC